MKGYKAFKKGMICEPVAGKPFQYAENTVYEQEEDAKICERGFHFCEKPLDVLNYYPLVDKDGNLSEFAEVEALDDCKTNDNKKYCTKKIKIGAKLSFADLVQASINFEKEVGEEEAGSSGDLARIGSSGYYARIGSSGNFAQIGSSGNYARIGSSGYYARIGSSGYYAQIGSSGNSAQIGSSGDYAQIGSSGNSAQIVSEGGDSVICCAGNNSCVRAKKGSWITLAEWGWDAEKGREVPVCVKTEFVDGERIKEDVFYYLQNGEFKEVE